jgi:hypothetical protein
MHQDYFQLIINGIFILYSQVSCVLKMIFSGIFNNVGIS